MKQNNNHFWIEKLNGKYYGTHITNGHNEIVIWQVNPVGLPSHRELAEYEHPSDFEMHDLHYEDKGDYNLAVYLKDCLNNYFNQIKDEANQI